MGTEAEAASLSRGPRTYLWWVLSRLAMLVLLGLNTGVETDVNYYRLSLGSGHGMAHTLVEYPVAAYGLIDAVWSWLPSTNAFLLGWLVLMLVIDLAFFVLLARSPGHPRAVRFWILAGPALGPIIYFRFDLVPAVLVGLACLYAARRPQVAGAAVAIAALIKYWPAVVVPGLVRQARERSRLLIAAVGTAVVGALCALAVAGWHRQFTPLIWQKQRGLEYEAVWATPAMILRWFRPHDYTIGLSAYESVDVTGPGVSTLITLTTVTEIVVAVLIGYAWWRRRRDATPANGMWLVLATTSGFIISDKVFSTQYLLWLLPVAAVALLFDTSRTFRRWAALLLATSVLTQLRYPFLQEASAGMVLPTVVVTVRNGLMIGLFALALREALRTPVGD
ncbi:hypothetical protein Back2_08290 [Nocardioides baekrokdamisoli]|uniref:DUF2029 domain-containing protein n=1 Tax=Nocardioides baekrokdamisoli TaxID=1804624 RepID=A0A3G9IDU9_9ACTN|nr:glycosyltransferase 87 family protein [Nocardioides baekrokdamisoli]BBH16542.1 hypothetical protein Back2_08290 [Nocardioides baekrokdamisoli]